MKDWVFHRSELDRVLDSDEYEQLILDVGGRVVDAAQAGAPRDTGAGAASIHVELVDGEARVSWDPEHDYLRYGELGTEHQPARPFLRAAAARYR